MNFSRHSLLACAAAIFSLSALAQNLVPNPGFDTVINCQTGILFPGSTISDAEGWVSPNQASADHFNDCHTTFSLQLQEPVNFMGDQEPLSGDSYAGMITYEDTTLTSNYREYIQIALSEPLSQDVEYSIGFHCSLAEKSLYASDGLGMYISVDQAVEPSQYIMNYSPQLVTGMVEEEENWVQVFGTYTATGGEGYVTIGSFTNDDNVVLQETTEGFFNRAYYYVDDVYVIDSTNIVGLELKGILKDLSSSPNPATEDVTISFGRYLADVDIVVSDFSGREWIRKEDFDGDSVQIDFSELPVGVYFVNVRWATIREVIRVVKEG